LEIKKDIMKIRMLNNSIRLRLSQGDIKVLEESGKIIERVNFPSGQELSYSLMRNEEEMITADFMDSEINTFIPVNLLSEWINTDKVGFEQDLPISGGGTFKILIEKDFKCLTERSEDESDLFPHPDKDILNC
jgi:hypothetical protein